MNEAHDPNRTIDVPSTPVRDEPHDPCHTVDHSSAPADSLDAGLAAGFGPPRSSLGDMRPVLLKEAEGDSAHVIKPHSDAMPSPEQTGDRYQLHGEIARGGMGAVLRGRDVDLGRDLAVKVLLEKHADNPAVARRFLEEAQIGGQLQHPGVVPVYDIGRFGERPFFTMKLVKGLTLAALLSERSNVASPELARRASEVANPCLRVGLSGVPKDLPRLLNIALQVAQTLAYAHAKGVIHRDLKPANVMVGAFGEVQVMDWGLAKVLAEGGIADQEKASRGRKSPEEGTLIRTARSSGSAGSGTDTEAGSLLGTPAYMPPEQANGDVALLDRRADVFGLGAILCEVLTGKPPYVGRSSEEVRRKACNGDLADATARLGTCGADAELVVLTKTCLAAEANDRPKDAQAVADGLAAYLNGVQERLHQAELAEAEARAKAAEEAKRRRLTLALAATVLLALTLGGGGWLWVKNERDARQAQVTREVNDALNKATALREQAKAAPVAGMALFAQAREQAQRALALVENGSADATLLAQVRQLQDDLDEEENDRKLVAALDAARLAQAETLAGENRFANERAVPQFREAFEAYGLPAGEGEPKAAARHIRQRPAAVREAMLAALEEWESLAADAKLKLTEPHREWLRAVMETAEPAEGWMRRFRAARDEKDRDKRKSALEKLAVAKDVGTLPVRALTRLAGQLDKVGAYAAAAQLLRRAQRQHPADFWVNHNLGDVLQKVTPREWDEAVRFLTAAAALRPDSPGVQINLGNALLGKGQVDAAIACYQKAIEIDRKYIAAHCNLGWALERKGQVDESIACYRKAIEIDPKFAVAHISLGSILCDVKRDYDGAIACFRKTVELVPKDANAHLNLGNALRGKGQVDAAIACYQKAIALDPKYIAAHDNLGNALKAKGKVDEAIASYKKSIALDPKNAMAHYNLGFVLLEKGQHDEASACFRKAIALDPKRATAHLNLGSALLGKGQVDEAIASYRQAIAVDPKLAIAHANLGAALRGKGKLNEAIACFLKAIELDPKDAGFHRALGIVLAAKGKVDEAIACYKKAIALDPKLVQAHYNLGAALRDKGKLDEAIACYHKAIALDAKDANAHYNLGEVLRRKGQVDEAIACYRKAIELDPKDARPHIILGNVLAGRGKVDAAIACFLKAIALDPKDALAHNNLGNALMDKGQLDEAVACYKKAITLDPKFALAHLNLGRALYGKGRFAESLAALTRGHELGTKQPGWPYPSAEWVRQAEAKAALEAKLPAFLKGEFQPRDNTERLALIDVCQAKRLHRAAARLYADTFAADPELADDLQAGHRYNAACHAALAAAGQGADAAKLDARERTHLWQQALDWLKADLSQYAKRLQSGSRIARRLVTQQMQHWQKDSDLAGIRERAALAKLPAEERAAWEKLWAEVAALLKKAEEKPK